MKTLNVFAADVSATPIAAFSTETFCKAITDPDGKTIEIWHRITDPVSGKKIIQHTKAPIEPHNTHLRACLKWPQKEI